jgi:membrane protease YdiL (CAAX protease family)
VTLDPDAFERALEEKALERPELAAVLGAATLAALALGALGLVLLYRDRSARAARGAPPGPPPEARWGLLALAAFLVCAPAVVLAASWLSPRIVAPRGFIGQAIVPSALVNGGLALLAVVVAGFALGGAGGRDGDPPRGLLARGALGIGLAAPGREGPATLLGLRLVCMAFPLYSLVQIASTRGFQALGWRREPNPAAAAFLTTESAADLAAIALLAVLLAPLAEEVLFRGFLLPPLRRLLGFRAAAAATSLLFALLHPPMDRAAIFVLGYALAVAYERSGSLRAPLAAHAANNAWGIVVLAVERYVYRA